MFVEPHPLNYIKGYGLSGKRNNQKPGLSLLSEPLTVTRKQVYTTTVETLLFLFAFSGLRPLWCIPVDFSGPLVYTLVPCFPKERFCTIVLFALWPWGRATDRERVGTTMVVYTLVFQTSKIPGAKGNTSTTQTSLQEKKVRKSNQQRRSEWYDLSVLCVIFPVSLACFCPTRC